MIQLTNRDYSILKTISELKYFRLDQIRKLFFPSLARARDRINILSDHHYLKSMKIAGIDIYCLDIWGLELFPGKLIKKPSFLFMNHQLSVNDFYVDLKLAVDDSGIKLAKFIPEFKIDYSNIIHYTDSAFSLSSTFLNDLCFFFLEVDKSTESWPKFSEMLDYYYCLFEAADVKPFRLLIVCDSSRRLNNIRKNASTHFNELFLHFCWIKTAKMSLNQWKSLNITDNKNYDIQLVCTGKLIP